MKHANAVYIAFTAALITGIACIGCSKMGTKNGTVTIVPVDTLSRIYPDREPVPMSYTEPLDVPRGGSVSFQFSVTSADSLDCRIEVTPIQSDSGDAFGGTVSTFRLLPVHVEGNTQGRMCNFPGGPVPEGWLDLLIREAPFDVYEVLVEAGAITITADSTYAIALEVDVPPSAQPGTYAGALRLVNGNKSYESPFSFTVHRTEIPENYRLHSTHWLWPDPINLTSETPPEWWSEEHWRLIEQAGRQLRRYGDDTIFTPLTNYREPLIQIIRTENGRYAFDYSLFDRWIDLFDGLGFTWFSGHHILGLGAGTFVLDRRTGEKTPLLDSPQDREAWFAFLPTFYRSLYAHLAERGLLDRYIQSQYDEPSDEPLYRRLTSITRTFLPGVKTIDAINKQPNEFSPLVDVHVFNLMTLNRSLDLAHERRVQEKGVWLYHCTSPYPPYPNRHIDRPLAQNRLWPWICQSFEASGYLYWAANLYRGADEYATSIGPFPNESQNPGHPPGDAWFFYRGPDGLRPSIRMLAFRDGMIDHQLLTMLGEKDPVWPPYVMKTIFRGVADYSSDSDDYHRARKTLLDALDRRTGE